MIETKQLKALLTKSQCPKELGEKTLEALAASGTERQFADNVYLLRTGDPADRFFLVREGRVSIELPAGYKRTTAIQTIDAGELLGWSWLIPPYQFRISARAVGPVSVYSFDAKTVRERMDKDHDVGYEIQRCFTRLLAQRLEGALSQIVGLTD